MAIDDEASREKVMTRRELEILELLSEGLSDRDIAIRLFLSVGTVKWHVKNIYSKLGVERRTQAVKYARERDLFYRSGSPLQPFVDKLPPDTTSFIDRLVETERILQNLTNSACQLLTLVGTGGIGKTRLAIRAARNMPNHFKDGKVFVSLVGINSAQHFAPTIADALSFSFYSSEAPEEQLLRYLRTKDLLLVLDNYEHLLPEVDLLVKVLEQAPAVKLLVTSRERLNLREEWVFQVDGLPVQTGTPQDAVTLFVERAGQINSQFQSTEQALPFMVDICRQVEGIPLAIELAAGWARSLSAKEIAQELGISFQLLTTGLHNVPERHRSMRRVFEQTWARLTTQEQQAVECLSVFRGGYTRDAAEQVANADLSLLAALHDKCLITLQGTGRYGMHELLRQFGEDKLALDPDRHTAMMQKHCEYFAQLLWEKRRAATDTRQLQTLVALRAEIDNIRQAWEWLVTHEDWDSFELAWETVNLVFFLTGQFHEAKAMFTRALNQSRLSLQTETHYRVKNIALTHAAFALFMTNQVDEGLKLVDEALENMGSPDIDDQRLLIFLLHTHICLLWAHGNNEQALEQCHLLLDVVKQTELSYYHELAHYDFGIVYLHLGEFEHARSHFHQLMALNAHFGRAFANNFLGRIAETSGELHEAQSLFAQSVFVFREMENRFGIATSLINLGRVMGRNRALWEAAACLYEALDLALDIQTPQTILGCVIELAFLMPAIERLPLGIALLEFLQSPSDTWVEYRMRIEPYLATLRTVDLEPGLLSARSAPKVSTLEEVVEIIQAARTDFQRLQDPQI